MDKLSVNPYGIQFDIMDSDEIKNGSVLEITSASLTEEGGFGDPKMGASKDYNCATCSEGVIQCPGHFGHISLNEWIYHPLFIKYAKEDLECFCSKCYKGLLLRSMAKLRGLDDMVSKMRKDKTKELISNLVTCPHCSNPLPEYSIDENRIYYVYGGKKQDRLEVTPKEALDRFYKTNSEEKRLMGIRDNLKVYIMKYVPVIPKCCRPAVLSGSDVCEDDLTFKYVDIFKHNVKLLNCSKKDRKNHIQALEFHISTLFDNKQGKAKQIATQKPIKGISDRLEGKGGRMRGNLQGKRVEFSGRTVFTLDVNLSVEEIGIPQEWADTLTFPEIVNENNLKEMKLLLNSDQANGWITSDGKLFSVKDSRRVKGFDLEFNDVVHKPVKEFFKVTDEEKILKNVRNLLLNREISYILRKNGDSWEKIYEYAPVFETGESLFNSVKHSVPRGWEDLRKGNHKPIQSSKELFSKTVPKFERTDKLFKEFKILVEKFNIQTNKKYKKYWIQKALRHNKKYDLTPNSENVRKAWQIPNFSIKKGDIIYLLPSQILRPINTDIYEMMKEKKFNLTGKDFVKCNRYNDTDGKYRFDGSFKQRILSSQRILEPKIGDKIERKLRNGDIILYNRQPSLHKFSILSGKAKIHKSKTMQLNVANCAPLNADCDGDELNVHPPQTIQAVVEALELTGVRNNLCGGRDSGPVLAICQDALTGGYKSTEGKQKIYYSKEFLKKKKEELSPKEYQRFMELANLESKKSRYVTMPREEFMDCVMAIEFGDIDMYKKMDHICEVYLLARGIEIADKEKDPDLFDDQMELATNEFLYTGHGLFSMLLPDDLEIVYNNQIRVIKIDEKSCFEPVIIKQGVMLSGTIDKSLVGKKTKSLIDVLNINYNPDICVLFINNYQKIINQFFLNRGFSVGIQDCISGVMNKDGEDMARKMCLEEVDKIWIESKQMYETEKNPMILEKKINGLLNRVNTIGEKIAKDSLRSDNAFVAMILPGAKGNFVNISQIITIMGQQNVNGERVPMLFKGRTLPHFQKKSDPIFRLTNDLDKISLYREQGLVVSSLFKGLRPDEFFFHAMGGRVGIIDTAVKTQETGYTARRLVKKMEDLQYGYNGTITTSKGAVISFDYNNGFDPSKTTNIKGASICDVRLVINRLNRQFEIKNKIPISIKKEFIVSDLLDTMKDVVSTYDNLSKIKITS